MYIAWLYPVKRVKWEKRNEGQCSESHWKSSQSNHKLDSSTQPAFTICACFFPHSFIMHSFHVLFNVLYLLFISFLVCFYLHFAQRPTYFGNLLVVHVPARMHLTKKQVLIFAVYFFSLFCTSFLAFIYEANWSYIGHYWMADEVRKKLFCHVWYSKQRCHPRKTGVGLDEGKRLDV